MTDEIASKTPLYAKMVKVNWAEIEPGLAVYADNLITLFDGKSMHVTFAQMSPPLIFGANEAEKQAQLNKISSVVPIPVARLVIPLEAFRTMLHALQEQLDKIDTLLKP
jgi:hypothetical protein